MLRKWGISTQMVMIGNSRFTAKLYRDTIVLRCVIVYENVAFEKC